MNFYETRMGRQFFTRQLPQLIRALEDMAKTKTRPVPVIRLPGSETNDILSDLYYERYMPDCHLRRKNDPLDREVHETMGPLLQSLSPEQKELFLQYEAAASARAVSISERAYKDGVRLAVQVMMAGWAGYKGDTA